MIEEGRPAWPPRSLIDPASVRAVLSALVDAVLMWWGGKAVDKALADVRALRERDASENG